MFYSRVGSCNSFVSEDPNFLVGFDEMVSRLLFEVTVISESTFKLLGIGIVCKVNIYM